MNSRTDDAPIFIGGTGRSGTSIMASMLNTHPDIVMPGHENKLIVERNGLRDLVEALTGRHDTKRRHYAVAEFAKWAQKLRDLGFRDGALNAKVLELQKSQGIGLQEAIEAVARQNPKAEFALHAIGRYFGVQHYDQSVKSFINRIVQNISKEGIVIAEGILSPYITPKIFNRQDLLGECRSFLGQLYSVPLENSGAKTWCDDTPLNWLYIDFLSEIYPRMKFIHMVRDPRDVIASYLNQVWSVAEPDLIVHSFKEQFENYIELKSRYSAESILEIRLEDIQENKDQILEDIAAFLGVENQFSGELFFNDRVNAGTRRSGVKDAVVELIESELADWMEQYGYLN